MSDRRTPFRRLLALLGLTLLACALMATASQADPFGELSHFAEKTGELREPEAALGVDPEDGAVFVVDTEKEGKVFRLQKFEKVEGAYKAVASTTFKPKDPVAEGETEVQGVAIDPSKHRVYLLAIEERSGNSGKIDPFAGAASEIYAFSTIQSGSKLEPAEGTAEEGVLTSTKELEPTSQKYGKAILEPGGITVNPVNHQILIAGYEDLGKKAPATQEIPVVQAIEPSGVLATKWSDEKGFFSECGCINSPAVTSAGHILVIGEENEIDELPSNLSPAGEVKQVYELPVAADCVEVKCPYVEKLTEFPGSGSEAEGGQMSIGPEGNIYLRDRIRLASEEGFENSGVMILSPGFVEQGFIGGGTPASGSGACAADDRTNAKPVIAAGANKEEVFMLSRPTVPNAVKATPKIMVFGAGGANCPKGTATTPTAKAGGVELEKFPLAEKIAFSSAMTQANAVKVEWEYTDGKTKETETVSERQQETTLVEHTFHEAGTYKVIEKITTDNLATPTITKERSVTLLGAPLVKGEKVKIKGEEVTLEAEVNPNLENTSCEFEYGPVGTFTTKVACPTAPGEGEELVPESKTVKLEEGKEYNFRLVAKSLSGTTTPVGTKFFVPIEGAPKAETLGASEVGSTTATVNGSVNPEGVATTCKFEYGSTSVSEHEAPCATEPGSGKAPVAVSAALKGLTGSTSYKYRLSAENTSKVKGVGAEKEFKTTEPGAAPTPETLAASEIGQSAATLNGSVNPGGEPTTCEFEYGTALPSGKTVPCSSSPGSGRSAVAVSASLAGLTPGTSYSYKLIAKNPLGEVAGKTLELKTLAKLAPVVTTGGASAVGETSATVTGTVNPNGETTSCKFLYGPTSAYGSEAACAPAPGGGTSSVAVAGSLAGLAPGTVYHYKLVASSAAGTTEGADAEFKSASPSQPPAEKHEVLPNQERVEPAPIVASIASASITVSKSGSFTLKLSCPAGVSQCSGTVTVKTISAVAASRGISAKAKKAILTLASVTFTISGGQAKTVTLHLSSKARQLLAKTHTIRARATIVAQNPQKESHTSTVSLTLKKHR